MIMDFEVIKPGTVTPHLERLQFSDLVAECKEFLASVGKILKNMVAKGADSEPPALVETEVVAELAPLQEEVFFRSTQVEELPNETLVDLSTNLPWS